jgi:hypothetical protein
MGNGYIPGSLLWEKKARDFAMVYHEGAFNKYSNEKAWAHAYRVVYHLSKAGCGIKTRVVGWLHDTVEDTSATLELIEAAFDREIRDAVDAITHRPGESLDDYYKRVGMNKLALEVKLLGDLADNTDPERRALLSPPVRERLGEKYLKAYRTLVPYVSRYPNFGKA